jgi:hypothetical protein
LKPSKIHSQVKDEMRADEYYGFSYPVKVW